MISRSESSPVPFLKWAGGKRWLINSHPELLDVKFNRYLEPFLGSGAVFFHLEPTSAILSDSNEELILTYRAIKDNWQKVFNYLRRHHCNHSADYYYQIRAMRPKTMHTRAARFIYLNRTCWNGLYRVNTRGKFNVPKGTKSNVLLNSDDFEAVARVLQNTQLYASDFEQTIKLAKHGDFVFVDPPYTVQHGNNGFIKYNESLFSWRDQERLRDLVVDAKNRGVNLLVMNASHKSLKKLYRGVGKIAFLTRPSVIGGSGSIRGAFQEMAVKCF